MSETAGEGEQGPRLAMRRGLRFVLIAQAVIAGLMLFTHGQERFRDGVFPDREETRAPVSPGDQRRHYETDKPARDYLDPSINPPIEMPAGMPERLTFTVEPAGDLGDVLLIHGRIAEGDADRFEEFLDREPDAPETVAINSPGGAVIEALAIGRLLRDRGSDTLITAGTICMSACPYMLAGGVERRVSLDGAVGLHQHYYDAPGYLPVFIAVEGIQHGQGQTMEYLIDMGVDPGLMLYSLNTPPDDIYVLVEDELTGTRLATGILP